MKGGESAKSPAARKAFSPKGVVPDLVAGGRGRGWPPRGVSPGRTQRRGPTALSSGRLPPGVGARANNRVAASKPGPPLSASGRPGRMWGQSPSPRGVENGKEGSRGVAKNVARLVSANEHLGQKLPPVTRHDGRQQGGCWRPLEPTRRPRTPKRVVAVVGPKSLQPSASKLEVSRRRSPAVGRSPSPKPIERTPAIVDPVLAGKKPKEDAKLTSLGVPPETLPESGSTTAKNVPAAKKSGGGKALTWLLVLLVLAMIAGGAFAVFWIYTSGGRASEVEYLSDEDGMLYL